MRDGTTPLRYQDRRVDLDTPEARQASSRVTQPSSSGWVASWASSWSQSTELGPGLGPALVARAASPCPPPSFMPSPPPLSRSSLLPSSLITLTVTLSNNRVLTPLLLWDHVREVHGQVPSGAGGGEDGSPGPAGLGHRPGAPPARRDGRPPECGRAHPGRGRSDR